MLSTGPGIGQELNTYELLFDASFRTLRSDGEEEGENYCALPCTKRLSIYIILVFLIIDTTRFSKLV